MNELDIFNIPLPQATDTYVPVAHEFIINGIKEQLDKRNMNITNSKYSMSSKGNRLIGYYDIQVDGNDELGLRFGFRNSYDKSMSIAIVSGAQVWICSNGLVRSDGINFIRKHTGNVLSEVTQTINEGVSQLENRFISFSKIANQMKEIEMSKKDAASLYGRAFILNNLFNYKQFNAIKNQLNKPSFNEFKEESLWSAYNHVTYVLKESSLNTYFQQHVNWHRYIEEEYDLAPKEVVIV